MTLLNSLVGQEVEVWSMANGAWVRARVVQAGRSRYRARSTRIELSSEGTTWRRIRALAGAKP